MSPLNNISFHKGVLLIAVTILSNCTQKATTTEEMVADTITTAPEAQTIPSVSTDDYSIDSENPAALWPPNIISHSGIADNNAKRTLENFSPLVAVLESAARCVAIKDSLEIIRGNSDPLTDPADSQVFRPYELQAWKAILEYKKWIATGPKLNDQCPSLLELTHELNAEDKSASYLPQADASKYLTHGKFFFIGGAPFIHEVIRDDGTPFTNARGNPEKHYATSLTTNCDYLLNSVYHFRNIPINITFGKPLDSYDMGPQEVNGVGSLIHDFVGEVHVFFLTENGVIPARLVAAEVKLVPEGLGCVSDQPNFIFACEKNIDEKDILATYIPYHSEPVTAFKLTRHENSVWTADVNEDGIADLACVSSSFAGASSDTNAEVLWFVNIDGSWQIIDYAHELDCT